MQSKQWQWENVCEWQEVKRGKWEAENTKTKNQENLKFKHFLFELCVQ